MSVYYRYPEDLTGTNPDNLVTGELHSLSDRPIRVVVPKYGPFYVDDTLVLFDNFTQRPLIRGTDYRVPMIVQEATLRTGKEVGDAILIENPSVSPQIRISYQNLGADYQSNIENIVRIYESYLDDNRSVDWLEGIYGKPNSFPPSPHPHYLSDLFGFEPMTVQMERIAQAILLGNTPAFEQFLKSVDSKMATLEEMEAGEPLKKFVTLEGMLHVLDKYNFNTIIMEPNYWELRNGGTLWFDVFATNIMDEDRYYWTIEHTTSSEADFVANSGVVSMVHGEGRFSIQASLDIEAEPEERFKVALRRNSPTGQIVATTRPIPLIDHRARLPVTIQQSMMVCCERSPQVRRTAKLLSIVRSRRNASYT